MTGTGSGAKTERIHAILEELYPDPPIPLDHTDTFTLLVAVVLSAQTTDRKVNEVTPALFAAAPTPAAMAALSEAEILGHIRQVGLAPQKAKALKGLATKLVAEHRGEVPRTFEELEALPGVGHKTASVVMVQAFGLPAFPVDTHIHRLAWRWGLSDGSSVVRTERDLKQAFDEARWSPLHLRIIYFGREHCPALRHDLDACPICSWAAPPGVRAAESLPRTPPPRAGTNVASKRAPSRKATKKKSPTKRATTATASATERATIAKASATKKKRATR